MASKGLPPPITVSVGSAGWEGCCAPVARVGAGGGEGGGLDGPLGGLSVGISVANVSVLEGFTDEEATGVRVTLDMVVGTVVKVALEVVTIKAVVVFLLGEVVVAPDEGHNSSTRLPARACPNTELGGAVT